MNESLNVTKRGQQIHVEEEESEMDRGTDFQGQGWVNCDWKLNSSVTCRVTLERMEASRFQNEMRHTHSQSKKVKCSAGVKAGKYNESLTCRICSKILRCPSELKLHFRIHTKEKPFTCPLCKRGFRWPVNLKRHSFLHTEERPYKCDVCQLGFKEKNRMNLHKKRCHRGQHVKPTVRKSKIKINMGKSRILKRRNTKFHECNVCSKKCDCPSELKSHMRTHTGEKPFICPICKCGFGQPQTLKIHLIVHTGLKPFKCDICDRAFGFQHSMRRHKRTVHAGKSMGKKEPNGAGIAERKTQRNFKDTVDDKSRESVPMSDHAESRDVRPSSSSPSSDSSDQPRDPAERARQWTTFLTVFTAKMSKK